MQKKGQVAQQAGIGAHCPAAAFSSSFLWMLTSASQAYRSWGLWETRNPILRRMVLEGLVECGHHTQLLNLTSVGRVNTSSSHSSHLCSLGVPIIGMLGLTPLSGLYEYLPSCKSVCRSSKVRVLV